MTNEDDLTFIKDPTVRIKPGDKLLQYVLNNSKHLQKKNAKVPDSIKAILKSKNVLLENSDLVWLDKFLKEQRDVGNSELLSKKELDIEVNKILSNNCADFDWKGYLEEKNKNLVYLNDLLKGSELILPKNEIIKRDPALVERIEKLKREQANREYKEMTRNVDTTKKFHPEDTISYELNMMNRHLIAVAQFLISVAAGFAFGFLGIELIVGNINFGMRLILGISCALIIAVAEFYFLAKHLNAEEREATSEKPATSEVKTKAKLHMD